MKKIIYVFGLLLVLLAGIVKFHNVFSFKYGDGIADFTAFYELEEDSVDMLVLGSSHAFENINPMVIWEDAKIAAFDLCGSVAPLWNSYYYLKEALKTQSPKLVVLEAYCLVQDIEYIDDSRIIKNVYGMKPSFDKLDALKVSAPKERWAEFGLEYIQYHNRYKELSAADFRKYQDNVPFYSSWKGFGNNFEINAFEMPKIENDGAKAEIPAKQKEYYQKIIDLCAEEDMELLIVVAPYSSYNVNDMAIFNTARDMAESAGVAFVNFNDYYDEIAFDWETDFADSAHMSYLGNARFSHYLSGYLLEHYEWDSHDSEKKKYESWDKALLYYNNSIHNKELTLIQDLDTYVSELENLPEHYMAVLSVKGVLTEAEDTERLREWMASRGISNQAASEYAWIIDRMGVQRVEESRYGYYWAERYGTKELLVDVNGIYWDRTNYQKTTEGVNIVIFDQENQTVADAFGINGGELVR